METEASLFGLCSQRRKWRRGATHPPPRPQSLRQGGGLLGSRLLRLCLSQRWGKGPDRRVCQFLRSTSAQCGRASAPSEMPQSPEWGSCRVREPVGARGSSRIRCVWLRGVPDDVMRLGRPTLFLRLSCWGRGVLQSVLTISSASWHSPASTGPQLSSGPPFPAFPRHLSPSEAGPAPPSSF